MLTGSSCLHYRSQPMMTGRNILIAYTLTNSNSYESPSRLLASSVTRKADRNQRVTCKADRNQRSFSMRSLQLWYQEVRSPVYTSALVLTALVKAQQEVRKKGNPLSHASNCSEVPCYLSGCLLKCEDQESLASFSGHCLRS